MKKQRYASGFTLVEILIVITIISILGVMGIASYTASQRQSQDGRRVGDLKQIQSALESYFSQEQSYPASPCADNLASFFPQGFPKDPTTNTAYTGSCDAASYCFCVEMLNNTAGGNSGAACNWAGGNTHYCVQNLQ